VSSAEPTQIAPPDRRLAATELRCERLVDPLGLDVERPAFEWVATCADGGAPQLAYQVVVATSRERAAQGDGDAWDSGRVVSSATTGVSYGGAPLRSRARLWWSVRLWSTDDADSPWAPPATFEMGLLQHADWQARWIGADAGISSPLLRREFELAGGVRRARAYVCGLGYHELRLNGAKVCDHVLEPAQTSYDHDPQLLDGEGRPTRIAAPRVLYVVYDVTAHLRAGANAVGVILGHGWYSAEADKGPGPLPRKPWGDRPRALVQLEVELQDGTRTVVTSGPEGWRVTPGPITYNDYAHGERYDARAERPGWDLPGFDDGAWTPAVEVDGPAGALRAQAMEPVRVVETLDPVATRTSAAGATLLDFGQHVSGWTEIVVSGPAGAEVTLRHAGELTAEGELDDDANMGAWLPARQTDTYVVRGEGLERWEPRFTLHGFRHVELTAPASVQVHSARARVVHSDLAQIGTFACADALLNQIHANVHWTHRASFQGFPQDAAERDERVGWVGDPGWAIDDYQFTFDSRAFWLKWLDDLADAQLPDGRYPVICPIMWRGGIDMAPPDDYEVPDDLDTMVYWPYGAWVDFSGTSHPSVAWALYQSSGDATILARHYPSMRCGVAFLRSLSDDLIVGQGLGDHMEPQPDGTCEVFSQRTPVELISTAWFYRVTSIVARVAGVLGDAAGAREHEALAEQIRDAFNARFFDADAASYATGSQTARLLPLWFGIVPAEHRARAVAGLVEQIREHDDRHLWTGTMGTAALQHVLPAEGHAELLYEMATQTTFPSWGHQIAQGATTVWETWGGQPGFSRNMKLMASISTFLFQDVAGLAPAAPGWERIRVAPKLTGVLAHARARVRTVRGEAAVAWRVADGRLELEVDVPATATAEVWLPDGERRELAGGSHRITARAA
jgi:alpha-L-rhamnosidase